MEFIENINEISAGFERIILKRIQPFDVDFSFESVRTFREELKEKGYVYLRWPLLKEKVEKARDFIKEFLVKSQYMGDDSAPLGPGKGVLLSGFRPITHDPAFLSLVEGKELRHLMSSILQGEAETLETKWIRVLGPKEYTNTHSGLNPGFFWKDYYKFSNFKGGLLTCWLPLTEQGLKNGTICVCEASHRIALDSEETLGDYELPRSFLKFVEESRWIYADFKPGDLLIFNIKTIHSSFRNESESFRMNCDTRWHLKI